MVEYSRLMGEDEAGTRARFNAHLHELIEPTIESRRGRIVKTTGDGLLVDFASVVDAVQCAVDIQKGMADCNTDEPDDRRIVFRIGVNLGDVIIEGDDIHGDGVNVAARLEALADPGGVVISDKVHQEIRGKIEFASRDLGHRTLKNIAESVRVHQIDVGESARTVDAGQPTSPKPGPALPDKPSIVVLPFTYLSGDPSQDYFVDGLVEDLSVGLGREKWLFVIASPSAVALRDPAIDPRRVASELGVHYVLQGSVRLAANRVRIVIKLSAGQNGRQIWSDRFDDEMDNVFDMQDRLMAQVVAAIAPELRASEIDRAHRKPTDSLSAFDLYLQALPRFRTSLADNQQALALLDKAIALDPAYSSAYGFAARCYHFQRLMAWVPPGDSRLEPGIQFANRASELGKDDSEALWMAGTALVFLDGALDQGPALIDRSLSLNPSSANAWTASCLAHSCLGHCDTAIDHFQKSQRLNPFDQLHHLHWNAVGVAYLGADRIEEADEAADKTLNVLPTYLPGLRLKVATCGLLGRTEESGTYVQRILAVHPECSLTSLSEYWGPVLRRNPNCFANFIEGARLAGVPERSPPGLRFNH